MPVKFCDHEGCHEVAVKAARSGDHCRTHYAEDVLSGVELMRCEVVGPSLITDVRTNTGVGAGGTVELDPEETNVAALVAGGHVKVIPAETKAKAKPAEKG